MRGVRVAAHSETAKRLNPRFYTYLQPTIKSCRHIALAILALLLGALPGSAAPEQSSVKNVLLVFSVVDERTYWVEAVEPALRARFPGEIAFHETYLQSPDADVASYWEAESESLRRRFAKLKPDLVIADGLNLLEFALRLRDKVFPGVPILFDGMTAGELGGKSWPGVTGITVPVGVRETIDLALKLQPDAEEIALIGDDPFWVGATQFEIGRHRDRVREIDFIGLSGPELLDKLKALPTHTLVLFHYSPPASGQPPLRGLDLIDAVAERRPTFSAWSSLCLNHGCIGGAYEDRTEQASWLAKTAARLLSGEKPDDIPIKHSTDLRVHVDWRALRHWHIPESALPPGSVVEFKPLSPWDQYKWEIIGTLVVLVLLLALVVGLLANLLRRRRAEAANKRLAGQLLHVQDEERRRMARDLHDGTSQDLVAISLCLGEVLQDPNPDPKETRQLLEEARALSLKAHREVRSVSYALHPPLLDGTGLGPALQWYLEGLRKRSGLRIVLEAPPGMEPLAEVDGTLFRIVQESMSNILRHSGADTAKVRLERDSKCVRMSIEDNGHGMGLETASSNGNGVSLGVGIAGMRERVRQFGGTFEIRSGSTGTTVLVSVPVSEKAHAANHASG